MPRHVAMRPEHRGEAALSLLLLYRSAGRDISAAKAARACGVTPETLSKRMKRAGVPAAPPGRRRQMGMRRVA